MKFLLFVALSALAVIAVIAGPALAENSSTPTPATYRFENYPISTIYRGRVRLPDFRGRDHDLATFRTRITDSMRDGANFAGKYRVITIGCGTGCRFNFVGDLTTGRVVAFPLGGEDYGHLDLFYKLNSSLIIAVWDDAPETCSQEGFKIEKGVLTSLGRSRSSRTDGEYCSAPKAEKEEGK